MKPVGKTMKIARHNKVPERQALQQLLTKYRDTAHPVTGMLHQSCYLEIHQTPLSHE